MAFQFLSSQHWNQYLKAFSLILLISAALLAAPNAFGKKKDLYQITGQIGALAPNAGGQQSFSLKLSRSNWEVSLFSNQYLLAGAYPLTGATYNWRFPICSTDCWWQLFLQTGAGLSNGGPIGEITWGSIIPALPIWLPFGTPRYIPAFRVDITTQLIFVQWRAVSWSYPFWFGVSFPF